MPTTKFGGTVVPATSSFNPEGSRRWWSLFVGFNEGWSPTQGLRRPDDQLPHCLPDPVRAFFFQERGKAYSLDTALMIFIFKNSRGGGGGA